MTFLKPKSTYETVYVCTRVVPKSLTSLYLSTWKVLLTIKDILFMDCHDPVSNLEYV